MIFLIISLICGSVIANDALSQSRIWLRGEPSNHQGAVVWNADGTGLEPAAHGHKLPFKSRQEHYYLATADYGGVDPQATSGLTGFNIREFSSQFNSAFFGNGFLPSDLTVKWGLYTLGNDKEGEDWWVNGTREIRIYRSEQDCVIQLTDEDMVGGRELDQTWDIDWDANMYTVTSDTFFVEDRSYSSSGKVQAVAAAFLAEISGVGIVFIRPRQQITSGIPISSGQGRAGGINPTLDTYIEVVDAPTGVARSNDTPKPQPFALHQNFPNPFNPSTNINYELSTSSHVVLAIYNLVGQEVKTLVNEIQTPGTIAVIWDGRNEVGEEVGSGVYIYRLRVGEEAQTKKMLLLK